MEPVPQNQPPATEASPPTEDVPVLEDGTPVKCTTCGQCCKIYLSSRKGGSWPQDVISFEEHSVRWLDKFLEAGVLEITQEGKIVPGKDVGIEPLHDPLNPTSAREPWVDTDRCQFCHPLTGCLIPRPKRPELCRRFVCW